MSALSVQLPQHAEGTVVQRPERTFLDFGFDAGMVNRRCLSPLHWRNRRRTLGFARANKTLKNVKGAWAENQELTIENGGFKKQAQSQPTGFEGLGSVLAQYGGGGLLDQVLAPQPTDVSPGNEVLGQIFGSKDVSRTVAQNAATQAGLEPSLLREMPPLLLTPRRQRPRTGARSLGLIGFPTWARTWDLFELTEGV